MLNSPRSLEIFHFHWYFTTHSLKLHGWLCSENGNFCTLLVFYMYLLYTYFLKWFPHWIIQSLKLHKDNKSTLSLRQEVPPYLQGKKKLKNVEQPESTLICKFGNRLNSLKMDSTSSPWLAKYLKLTPCWSKWSSLKEGQALAKLFKVAGKIVFLWVMSM